MRILIHTYCIGMVHAEGANSWIWCKPLTVCSVQFVWVKGKQPVTLDGLELYASLVVARLKV